METTPSVALHPSGSSPEIGETCEATISVPSDLEDEDGMEDEDDGWKFIDDHGCQSVPNPVVDVAEPPKITCFRRHSSFTRH